MLTLLTQAIMEELDKSFDNFMHHLANLSYSPALSASERRFYEKIYQKYYKMHCIFRKSVLEKIQTIEKNYVCESGKIIPINATQIRNETIDDVIELIKQIRAKEQEDNRLNHNRKSGSIKDCHLGFQKALSVMNDEIHNLKK